MAVAFDGKLARAALPLVRRGAGMRALTAPYTTIYAPALPDSEWARFLGVHAHTYVTGSMQIDAVDLADASMAAFLESMPRSGLIAAQYQNFTNFYEPIGEFEAYWNSRPSRLKATVRRKLAQAKSQQAQFRLYRNAFAEAVEVYEEIYRRSWKDAEPHPRFIATMVDRLGRDGFVRMGLLSVGGTPVAAQIWLVCGGKATIFKLAHREDAVEYSPGTLLTHWMISTLTREEALSEIDFGRGADAYKRDWLRNSRTRTALIAGNWRHLAGLRTIAGGVLPTRLSTLKAKLAAR